MKGLKILKLIFDKKATVELVNLPFWYFFKLRKVGWWDQGRRNLCEGGRNCLNCLKKNWSRKEGRGHKDLKKGGQVGWRGWCLKKGGGWNLLTNYDQVRKKAFYRRNVFGFGKWINICIFFYIQLLIFYFNIFQMYSMYSMHLPYERNISRAA